MNNRRRFITLVPFAGATLLAAGKPGDAQGPCPVFAGKQVLATAWCSAYVKKTG